MPGAMGRLTGKVIIVTGGVRGIGRAIVEAAAREGARSSTTPASTPGWTRTRLVEEWFAQQPDPAAAEAHVIDVHPMKRIAT